MSVLSDWSTIRFAGKNIWSIARQPLLVEWGIYPSNPDRVIINCPQSISESDYEKVRNFAIQIRDALSPYSTTWAVRVTWPVTVPSYAAVPNQWPPPPPYIIPPLPPTTPPTSNDKIYYA